MKDNANITLLYSRFALFRHLGISEGRKFRAKLTYTPVKTLPQNIGIATEIASISVSVAKLLLLPVLVDFYFRFVFQMLNILTCAVVFVCFKHFHRKSVYLFKCKTITSLFHCIAYHLLVEFFFYSFIVSSFIVYCILCMCVCVCVYGLLPDSNKDLI